MNPCRITEDLLPLYVDGTLSEDSREYVETHLNECEECRKLHAAMKKSVDIVLSRRNAQTSFKSFKRRLFWRKFLLTMLCSIIVLTLLAVVLYSPIDSFLNRPFLMCIEPVESRLFYRTDGGVELELVYTAEDPFMQGWDINFLPNDPETVCISPYYTRMGQINRWWNDTFGTGTLTNGDRWLMSFTTDPSAAIDSSSPFFRLCSKIILKGSDGERELWEKGDILPEYSPWNDVPAATPIPAASAQPETTSLPATTPHP